ncbi:hypothetical protein Vretimale_452 [Volvox reticuliferus]|uniref:Uncharacterized protein n=1 Tax=Volvox reticuliferus TaxID=1737510 RepID=A0A8J4C0M0_9CHLO|nr:hypothetical protein Vretifemale_2474 [Volvox reticuliferus]GIL94217.1 hypothetical protein Vretimale_452 [Volvox reticuliferus]
MVFGRNRGSRPSKQISQADAANALSRTSPVPPDLDVAIGDVKSDMDDDRGMKLAHPFKLKVHDLKAHLRDRNTVVVDLRSEVDAPVDVMFDLLADPHQHARIFESIEAATAELVSEDGPVRKWRVDHRSRWKFWKVGGVCENRLWMTCDRSCGTVSFVLREPGFLRTYEATWTITGPDGKGPGAFRGAGNVTATAITAAAEAPPPPFLSVGNQPTISDYVEPQSHDLSPSFPATTSSNSSSRTNSRSSLDCGSSINTFSSPSSDVQPAACRSTRSATGGGNEGSVHSSSGSGSTRQGGCVTGLAGAGLFAAIDNPFTHPSLLMAAVRSPDSVNAVADKQPSPPLSPSPSPAPPFSSRSTATIQIRKSMSPKVIPPFPFNQMLKGHAAGQVNGMLRGLLVATAREIKDEMEEGMR